MKRIIAITALLFTLTATTSAMSYEQAREQALFLTDKMAYELNLTEEQYDAAERSPKVHLNLLGGTVNENRIFVFLGFLYNCNFCE